MYFRLEEIVVSLDIFLGQLNHRSAGSASFAIKFVDS